MPLTNFDPNQSYDTIPAQQDHVDHSNESQKQIIVTTIGLVIHCVADGMALGTSVFRKQNSFNLIFLIQLVNG